MTQAARTSESDNLLGEPQRVDVRHSYIRPKSAAPGSDAVPSFLIRDSADRFVLPHLLVWSALGLLAYGALHAGASTYHFLRDPRVTPLSTTNVRAELHPLLDQVARSGQLVVDRNPAYNTDSQTTHAAAIAFVPHTHVSHVKANAAVYECRLWSMFACEPVGHVVELLPGEVAATDTSGIPARGQYLLVQLTDPRAAEAETLRVRDPLDPLLREVTQPSLDEETAPQTLL